MPSTVTVNMLFAITITGGGTAIATPDTCKTPCPPDGSPKPIPYPNVANAIMANSTSKKVKCDKVPIMLSDSEIPTTSGDEAGVTGGVASGKIKGKAKFMLYSFDVKIEGKNVPRSFDTLLHNENNTPPAPMLG